MAARSLGRQPKENSPYGIESREAATAILARTAAVAASRLNGLWESSNLRANARSYVLSPLRGWLVAGLTAALLLGAGSGCQVLPSWEAGSPEEINIRRDLTQALTAVLWQARWDWSPTREWESREDNRPSASSLRWRFASNDWRDALARSDDIPETGEWASAEFREQDRLLELAQSDHLAGWNAAILLAQHNPARAKAFEPVLARLALHPPRYVPSGPETPEGSESNLRDWVAVLLGDSGTESASRPIPIAMQAAAAEAWCLVLAAGKSDPIEALAPAGRALETPDLPDDVRGELFRGIGRWVPPANIPGLDSALPQANENRPNPPALRYAALEACVLYALWNSEAIGQPGEKSDDENPWPKTLLDWQWEPDAYFEADPLMRRRFGHWLVLTGHENAIKVLESQLTDQDFVVRDEALVNLGRLKSEEALAVLENHARRPEPRVRAMAVKGLAHWGVKSIAAFVADESPEVRRSVAEELGRFPTRESAMHLKDLQADVSPDVETASLEAAKHWPDSLAIPVLFHGMEHASVQTRRECFRELRRRTGLEDTFPITAGPEVRRDAVERLARDWNLPLRLDLETGSPVLEEKINRLRANELRGYLMDLINPDFAENSARRQLAKKALKQSAAEDVPAIETFILEQPPGTNTDSILHEVLPALSPVHSAIEKLESLHVAERRSGVNELRLLAEHRTLSRLAVRRLKEALETESDGLVWRSALYAILPDDNPEAAQLAAWAANHPDAGLRRLACDYANRHKRPQFADWLLPLLHDRDQTVKLAAIEAAGWCGNRIVIDGLPAKNAAESLPGLRGLLADPDSRVPVAAAIAMSRLGDPQGHDELVRLSRHPEERIRLQIVAAMGTTRQTRFVETLIGIGWTAHSDPIKREVLNSLSRLVPRENHPPALAKTTGTDDKIRVWAEWWGENQRLPSNDSQNGRDP